MKKQNTYGKFWDQAEIGKTVVWFHNDFSGIRTIRPGRARLHDISCRNGEAQAWLAKHPAIAAKAEEARKIRKEWLAQWKKEHIAGRYDADRGTVRVVLENGGGMIEFHNRHGDVCGAPVYVVRNGGAIPPGFSFVASVIGKCWVAAYDCGAVDGSQRAADNLRSPEVWIGEGGAVALLELAED